MLPEMTEAVTRALEAARSWAARAGANEVRPIDLLCGLTDEEEGRAAVLLAEAGLDVAGFRKSLAGPAQLTDPDSAPSLSRIAQQVLAEATTMARSLSAERAVSSECLLLAILREDAT